MGALSSSIQQPTIIGKPLDVGAGGWADGIYIAPNGTMVVRTDTYGAYIWNGTQWQQLITSTSMPAGFVTPNSGEGVYEIQIAPSNTNILYMAYEGYVFRSTNDGATWTQTAFAQVTEDANDSYRGDGQKMAVDPNNPNIVYVGTPENGLFVTTNGGATWQSVSAVPVSQADSNGLYPGITGILFDPALGETGGNTNTIFAASYGNGVYESTNGGASWSLLSGGPIEVAYAAVSSTGVYYATTGSSLWSYANGTWTELLSAYGGDVQSVAIDPSNPSEIVVQGSSGIIAVSYNAGSTWSWNFNIQFSASDVPWLATTGTYMTIGGTVFDPLVPNELIASAGVGVWTTTLPTANFSTSTPVVWTSQSIGIEQLVANEIVVPPGGDPVLASWDRPFFYISNENAYPSSYSPNTGSTLAEGWSVDYASSDPTFVVGIADWYGIEQSGYSTNGGQSWTVFPSFPAVDGEYIDGTLTSQQQFGGTIAASTPENIIWAPSGGVDPYYTLNGGETWNPITLPGVSNWSGFDWAYYLDSRTVTADRVLPNTFYLYYAGEGVYETTNGGVSWTQVYSGQISPYSYYNAELESVPGEAGNLFFTGGTQSGFPSEGFYQSTDQGATWTAVPNVTEVNCFGFGAPAPGQSYPSIYIVGYVNGVYGIWQSINDAQSWTQIGTYPTDSLAQIKTISGDPNIYGQVYVGFSGDGYAYLPGASADPPSGPTLTSLAESPSSGDLDAGNTVTLTLNLSEAVTVAGGSPTLTLNDGGTATYTGGSGTDALTFSYTVAAGQNTAGLSATAINLNSATVTDSAGNAANLSLTGLTQIGPQIDTTPPTISSIVESPSNGDLNAGKVVTITLDMSEVVTVNTTGGSPTLTLNDGGTATYTGGSGTNALTFSYTVLTGQNTPDLMEMAVNLSGATITDAAGNAANLSLTGLPQGSPQIDTTTPTAPVIASDTINANNSVTLTGTAEANGTVTVYEGTTSFGTTTVNASGAWSFTTSPLAYGTHTLTATDTDAAGNTSPASNSVDPTIGAPAGGVPVIVINSADGTDMSSFTVASQQSVAASSLFTISNPSGDSITQYSFEDTGGGSGYFTLAGTVEPAGQVFTVSASNLNNVQYVGGSSAGTDTLTVDAYDATIGAWVSSVSLSAVTTATFPLANANDVTEAVYIGYFGRAGDPGGDSWWLNQLSGGNISEAGMAASFSVQTEATALYPFLASPSTASQAQITSFIESLYTDLFDRAADSGGLAFWDNYLTTNLGNPQVVGAFVLDVISGAQGTDQTTITNKVTVADYFTQELAAAGISFSSAADALAQSTIASVTSDPSTVLAAESTISSWTYGDTLITDPTVVMQEPGNASATIGTNTVLVISTPDTGAVTFTGTMEILRLEQPTTFTGTVSGFAAQDVIDLPGIAFGTDTTLGYLSNSNQTGGTLSLTDGTHSANIALLGSYMASSFVMEGDNHGGTMVVAEASQTSNQTLLTTSQHA